MKYKYFVKLFIVTSIFLMSIICILSCLIDPLGVFNIVKVKGINHYKGVQANYMDVWKPYEIKEKKPDIIFIGSSRVNDVIDVRSYKANYVAYNAGFSGLSLKDMDSYIDMICKVKKPKKIYIGLDLFQFGNNSFLGNRPGFSMDRLNNVGTKDDTIFLCKMHDTLSIGFKNIISVINDSRKNIDRESEFINGYYNNDYNTKLSINRIGYYGSINQYNKEYKNWTYSNNAMAYLKRIIQKANKNDIEVIVYFNPISIELMSLMRIYEIDNDLDRIKQEVTSVCGIVYDFNFVNNYTVDKKYFSDASHANRLFGNIIITNLKNKEDSEAMLVLTNKNIENRLEKERRNYADWKKNNLKYYLSMKKKMEGNEKVKEGDFKEFIGF